MRRSRDLKMARLRKVPAFANARERDLRALADAADEVVLPPGFVLERAGRVARECFLLTAGSAESSSGAMLRPGDLVGLDGALHDDRAAGTVTALTEVSAVVLTPPHLRALVEINPALRTIALTAAA